MTLLEDLEFFIEQMNNSLQDEKQEILNVQDSKVQSALLSGWCYARDTVDQIQAIYEKWK